MNRWLDIACFHRHGPEVEVRFTRQPVTRILVPTPGLSGRYYIEWREWIFRLYIYYSVQPTIPPLRPEVRLPCISARRATLAIANL